MDIMTLGIILENDLLETALLTVVIEVPALFFLGYQDKKVLGWFFVTNIVSNILLNEMLMTDFAQNLYINILIGELLVILLEYCMMLYVLPKEKGRLFLALLITNCASLAFGWLYINGGRM